MSAAGDAVEDFVVANDRAGGAVLDAFAVRAGEFGPMVLY